MADAKETNTEKSPKLTMLDTNKYENPNDPLFLHHSDQPGAKLVSQPLNEDNYNTWSRAMVMSLSAKNKIGFINGTIKKPYITLISEFQQWDRCNNLVKSWLLNSISEEIASSVLYCDTAHEIWTDLKERYSQVNSVHLFHIESEIHDCVQSAMSINSYFTKLKGLWDERDALCSIPTCSCDTMKEVLDYQQNQKTMKFLMGLNESYAAVRGQILLIDPLPTVNRAHSLVLREERQRNVLTGKGHNHEATTLAVRDTYGTHDQRNSKDTNRGSNFNKKNGYLKCDRYDKTGHTSETCDRT